MSLPFHHLLAADLKAGLESLTADPGSASCANH